MSTKWPKVKGVWGKTASPQNMVKLARSCDIRADSGLARNRLSPSILVFRGSMFFSRFRLFQHVWAYFVVTNFFSDFLWNLAGLRIYARNAVLGRGTKFDPPCLGRFWRYYFDFVRIHRQVGALPKKSKTTRTRPYFHFRFHRKHAMSRWSCVRVLLTNSPEQSLNGWR